MNTNMMTSPYRRLPSADWIAVGLAVVGFILGRLHFTWSVLFGLAVFGPFLLREMGWLKDTDEWQKNVMHRAGFHSTLVIALFIFLNQAIPRFFYKLEELQDLKGVWFDVHFLWQTLVLVFLISYLIQYWGAAKGVARVLFGFGAMMSVDIFLYVVRPPFPNDYLIVLVGVAIVGLFFLMAWMVNKFPKPMGYVLIALMLGMLTLGTITIRDLSPDMVAGMVSSQVHLFLVFGVTGLALLNSEKEESHD